MKTSDFNYDLPEELIAQSPLEKRSESRLLLLGRSSGKIKEGHFYDIVDYLHPGDVLVLNDTKVLPARVYGVKSTGARVEFLFLERLDEKQWSVLVKPGRRARVGDCFILSDKLSLEVLEILEDGLRRVKLFYEGIFEEVLEEIGTMPLPPYIHEILDDQGRYQTVYAMVTGSSAAPTAGLHFTDELLKKIADKGVKIARITLHVGLGTFRPVKSQRIEEHIMHEESYRLDEKDSQLICGAKRVIAVGTTSVRTLESIYAKYGKIQADEGRTSIFIYPGFTYRVVDVLITNFHLPGSTLVMLVSAFSTKNNILNSYNYAIKNKFRFFSFGDAMMITEELDV
ncbi:MAG: tRNA preQ1(34) S-adenosylmethionine ribosyltransferase-isomerase QueA [Tissierellia bacterium]|nr:tRNA preQ1(34) S-adenosylmethionine ribosyltransferase-isomerase QueA [Tissierellia bacterium]